MMKSSSRRPSSSSSSSSSSTSVTASPQTQLLSSSSSPPPPLLPRLNLQSPELQAEFLQEFRNKFRSHGDVSESTVASSAAPPSSSSSPFSPSSSSSSPLPSPFSPTPSSSPCSSYSSSSSPSYNRQARLSLSSPELLSELKDSRTRSLRHVPARNGLTTVFSGRGGRGRASDPAPSARSANQKTPR